LNGFNGAWNKLELPCDSQDRELFVTSTAVTIGDTKFAKFWSSTWAQGQTLKKLAPTLFKKAKRTIIMVHQLLQNNKWIEHISLVLSTAKHQEFVLLWNYVQ